MKKLIVLILILLSVSPALAVPNIDRSKSILYPVDKISRLETVYVSIESGYAYHHSKRCDTEIKILHLSKEDFVEMTEYEARLRGYYECPDCSDDLEYSDVSALDSIERTVNNTESVVDSLAEFIIKYFRGY